MKSEDTEALVLHYCRVVLLVWILDLRLKFSGQGYSKSANKHVLLTLAGRSLAGPSPTFPHNSQDSTKMYNP